MIIKFIGENFEINNDFHFVNFTLTMNSQEIIKYTGEKDGRKITNNWELLIQINYKRK